MKRPSNFQVALLARRSERVYAAPPSRAEHISRVRDRVQRDRQAFARNITLCEFGEHCGTRVSTSLLRHPVVPPTRGRQPRPVPGMVLRINFATSQAKIVTRMLLFPKGCAKLRKRDAILVV